MSDLYSVVEALDILKRKISEIAGHVIMEEQLVDVSLHHLHIVAVIQALDYPTTTQLASALQVTKPTVTALIKRLEEHGFIEKVPSAEDGRSYTIVLTDYGRSLGSLHHRIHERVAQFLSEYLDAEELQQFSQLLRKLLSQVK